MMMHLDAIAYGCGTHVGISGCTSAEGGVPGASNSRATITPDPVRETGVCAEHDFIDPIT